MATQPNPLDNEDLFNAIRLNGVKSPGKVVLSGHDDVINYDVQVAPFTIGGTLRFKSQPPIEFTATFYLLRDIGQGIDDFATWPAFRRLIDSTVSNPQKPVALPIYHPDLAAQGITTAVRSTVGGMTYDEKGGAVIAVKFWGLRPSRPKEGLVVATKKQVDPNGDLKAQVASLTDPAALSAKLIANAFTTPWS